MFTVGDFMERKSIHKKIIDINDRSWSSQVIIMETPLSILFTACEKQPGSVTHEIITNAVNEYKGRIEEVTWSERRKFDYLVSFLNDVGQRQLLDIVKHQYNKLLSETPNYHPQSAFEKKQTAYPQSQSNPGTDMEIHGTSGSRNSTHNRAEPARHANSTTGQPDYNNYRNDSKGQEHSSSRNKKRSDQDVDDMSKQASYNLKKNNPNIADLSDANRPTKIAERYSELYDNEWTEAFEVLTKVSKKTEKESINILHRIITSAYEFGKKKSDVQIDILYKNFIQIMRTGQYEKDMDKSPLPTRTAEDRSLLQQLRKPKAEYSIKQLQENYIVYIKKELPQIMAHFDVRQHQQTHRSPLLDYTKKCVDITWWMCVQDPPVEMCLSQSDGTAMDTTKYRTYTKTGSQIDFIVWPYITLHKDGPLLCKGVAQCK